VVKEKDVVLFSSLCSSQSLPSLSVSAGVEIFLLVIAPFPLLGMNWKATCLGDLFAIGKQNF
jgi:hypothetical protein